MGGCAGAEQKPSAKNPPTGEPTVPKPANSDPVKVNEPVKNSPANPPT